MNKTSTNKSSKNILLLIDYDGTLVEFEPRPELAVPTIRVLSLLKNLIEIENVKVIIISGRSHLDLERFFGHLPISIIAEHGAMSKLNGSWKTENISDSWKKVIYPIMNRFTLTNPHSFVEEKRFSLVWHYRNLPHKSGLIKSRELIRMLEDVTMSLGLKLLDGDKVIEVMADHTGKGHAVEKLIEENKFENIISIGDDKTDEEVFELLSHNINSQTIKVGQGETKAKKRLDNVEQVLQYLEQFATDSKTDKENID